MNELNEIISDYLQAKDTDYALMINGDWGCGKTYYLEHEFKEFVERQKCPFEPDISGKIKKISDENPSDYRYSPVFISLYGISSPEDFQYRVFLGVNKWANNKFVSVMASMGAKVTKMLGVELNQKDANNLTFISNHNVLVFDDLERICSDKISAKEVLGLINEYSEHNHYKVIIACNEDVYEGKVEGINRRDEEYWQYKEKTVRYTYRFEADVSQVYNTIANTYDNKEYKLFLEQQKKFILDMFDLGGKKNLRTLKFYIDSMFKIFCNTQEVKYKKSILRTLSVSTMIYATEYKNGREKEELDELKDNYNIDFGDILFETKEQEQENMKPSCSEEVDKIYGSFYKEMVKLPFVIDYLITGYLDKQALKEWVNEKNRELESAEVKPEYQLFRELISYATVEDDTLLEKLNLMIQYAKEGKYEVIDLMHMYALLIKYSSFGIEGFSLNEETEKIFIDAIDLYKDKWKYDQMLENKITIAGSRVNDQINLEKYNVLKRHVLQLNYQSKLAEEKAERDEFIQKAEKGDVEGIRHYRERDENRISIGGIDWSRVCKVMETGSNPIACEVAICLKYLIPNSSSIHKEDIEPLKNGLQKWLDDYSKKEDKRYRRIYINELKRHIDSIIRNYSEVHG